MTTLYGHFSQRFFDDGVAQGVVQGLERGLLQGREQGMLAGIMVEKRRTLEKLITRRFGPVSPEQANRIAEADLPTLDHWIDAVLEGSDSSCLFSPS